MKKIYTRPEIEVQVLRSTDVITLSSGGSISADSLNTKKSSEIDF